MNRKIKFSEGEYYHIYNRGVDKRKIFMDKDDSDRFLLLLNICNSILPTDVREMRKNQTSKGLTFGNTETITNIGAWCLMPNHFHILLKEKDNNIPKFIQKLSTAYTMYFNKKYERSGALFQGTFKAEHVDKDEYLKYLYSYIHLNPIKLIQSDWKEKGIQDIDEAYKFLNDYKYSSYLDYLNFDKLQSSILNKNSFPDYFESKVDFKNNLKDWLKYKENCEG